MATILLGKSITAGIQMRHNTGIGFLYPINFHVSRRKYPESQIYPHIFMAGHQPDDRLTTYRCYI